MVSAKLHAGIGLVRPLRHLGLAAKDGFPIGTGTTLYAPLCNEMHPMYDVIVIEVNSTTVVLCSIGIDERHSLLRFVHVPRSVAVGTVKCPRCEEIAHDRIEKQKQLQRESR